MSLDPTVEAMLLESVKTFHDRMEMMCLAFIVKHGRRPKLVFADSALKTKGWMAGFVSLDMLDEDESVHPKLTELVKHGERAWRQWTSLEPDAVVVLRAHASGESQVTIVPRTASLQAAVAGEVLRGMVAREGMG